jgi:hypothetical protein
VGENLNSLFCRCASIIFFSEPVAQEKDEHNQKNPKIKMGIHSTSLIHQQYDTKNFTLFFINKRSRKKRSRKSRHAASGGQWVNICHYEPKA